MSKKHVVFLSRTALAGAPWETLFCINRFSSEFIVHWVAVKTDYNDGRKFPANYIWSQSPAFCENLIKDADLIHVQNDIFPYCADLIKNKPRLVQFHSIPVRPTFVELCANFSNRYTIDQPMQMSEYKLPTLPNIVDFSTHDRVKKYIDILFAPTNGMSTNVKGSKGAKEVKEILDEFLHLGYNVQVFSNLEYSKNLGMKNRAKIIIDDVINNTWHKTSVEAGWYRAVIVTNFNNGLFYNCDLLHLRENLKLILKSPGIIDKYQELAHAWVVKERDPEMLVKRYEVEYNKILNSSVKK